MRNAAIIDAHGIRDLFYKMLAEPCAENDANLGSVHTLALEIGRGCLKMFDHEKLLPVTGCQFVSVYDTFRSFTSQEQRWHREDNTLRSTGYPETGNW